MKSYWNPITYKEIEYTKKCAQEMESCLWTKKLRAEFKKIKKIMMNFQKKKELFTLKYDLLMRFIN